MKRVNTVKTVYGMNQKTEESKEPASVQVGETTIIEGSVLDAIKRYHASLIVASNMIKSFHYCVVGMGFYTTHWNLRDFFLKIDEYIDDVAELLVTKGKTPVLHLSEALTLSNIQEFNFNGVISCKQAMTQTSKVFDALSEMADAIAYSIDNVGVSGIFGDHNVYFDKQNWMIKAYLQG